MNRSRFATRVLRLELVSGDRSAAHVAPIDAALQSDSHIPEGRSIYVLTTGVDDDFVKRHGLKIAAVFAGSKDLDSEIAVKPGVALPLLQSDGGT